MLISGVNEDGVRMSLEQAGEQEGGRERAVRLMGSA